MFRYKYSLVFLFFTVCTHDTKMCDLVVGESVDQELIDILEKVATKENIIDAKYAAIGKTAKGDGYMGQVSFAEIEGKSTTGEPTKLNLVVKRSSKLDKIREEMLIPEAFEREIYAYTKISPEFESFQKQRNIDKPFKGMAKCFLTSTEDLKEFVVLQNIKSDGYKLWSRLKAMNDDHVTAVLKNYGKYHGVSLAMRDQEREKFEKLADLSDIFEKNLDKTEMFYGPLIDNVCSLFDVEKESKIIDDLKRFQNDIPNFLRQVTYHRDQYTVILHGDCWCNNMMFKYEDPENPNKPTDVCFLDFQLTKLSSLVIDLSYFFYCCASNDMILNKFDHYMDIYYDSLSAQIKALGSDPEKLYPKSKLYEEWSKLGKFGFTFALMVVRIMYSEGDEVIDFAAACETGDPMDALDFKPIQSQQMVDEKLRAIATHLSRNNWF